MYRKNYNCKKSCSCNSNIYNKEILEDKCNEIPNNIQVYNDDCACGFDEEESVFPHDPMLAQSYVPWQTMNETFTPCVGLKMGTIFPELVSPYMPNDSVELNAYIEATNTIREGCNK